MPIDPAALSAAIAERLTVALGCGSAGKSKYRGENEKWFEINKARGTLKNYTPSGRKKKRAK